MKRGQTDSHTYIHIYMYVCIYVYTLKVEPTGFVSGLNVRKRTRMTKLSDLNSSRVALPFIELQKTARGTS